MLKEDSSSQPKLG